MSDLTVTPPLGVMHGNDGAKGGTPMPSTLDLQACLDEQSLSAYQWLIFILSFLVVIADGFDTGAIAYIAPSLIQAWGIERGALGPVVSAALVGMALGALTAGPLADRFGRKTVVILSVLFFGVGSIACALSSSLSELTIYRFLTGLGLGAAMPNVATLLAEFMPKRIRATMVNALLCAFPSGVALGGLLSAHMIPSYGWQSVLVLGGVLPLIVTLLIAIFMPESLHFMVVKGKSQEKIARAFQKVTGRKLAAGTVLHIAEQQPADNKQSALSLIVSKHFRLGTIMLWLACFMSLLVFYLLTSWLPILLKDIGFSTA
ncbi:MFS transporter [Neisseriaceae bacterium TC5R-5]|nr:MFS transporter [Neisseriaceae bacterium TC5R-5]